MDQEFLDRALAWYGDAERVTALVEARAAFVRATGEFGPGEPWWEERIAFFHDWFLLLHLLPDGRAPLRRFADETRAGLTAAELEIYGDLLSVRHRSLFEVERVRAGEVALADRIGRTCYSASFDGPATGWGAGDLVDAILLRRGRGLVLSRSLVFHPRPAREAIVLLVEYARTHRGGAPWDIVDLFARMKLAYERSETPRVAAIYTPESYLYREFVARTS